MDNFSLFKNIRNKICFIKGYLNNKIFVIKPKKFNSSKENNKIEIVIKNKNQINNKQKLFKKRNAGVDLVRIISMFGIVYVHVLFIGKANYKYNKYIINLNSSVTYVFWHNNAFSIISGVVSSKITKYSNLLYLWLCAVFYSLGFHFYYLKYNFGGVRRRLYKEYFPVIYESYWYFSSYFGMFIFLPVINKGIQYLSNLEFKLLVMSFLGIFSFWNNYINYKYHFYLGDGGSPMSLLYLYIIGAYIKKFNIEFTGIKRNIIILIYFSIFISLCFANNLYLNYINNSADYKTKLGNFIKSLMSRSLNGVLRTSQAILITLFFLQLKYNEYLSKFITFFGQLTFGVYLIHMNNNVKYFYLRKLLIEESDNLTSNEVIQMLINKSIKLFLECIIIEYLRNLLFNILKIKKICMLIEKIAFKVASFF